MNPNIQKKNLYLVPLGFLVVLLFLGSVLGVLQGQTPIPPPIKEDVVNTRHNLSSLTPDKDKFESLYGVGAKRNVFTADTTEICVFCHTPHGANAAGTVFKAPIWNRSLSSASYTLYDQTWSKSFEGEVNPGAPTGYSRLCLACHDGTIALGSVINKPGSGGFNSSPFNMSIPLPSQVPPIPETIPIGSGETTGDTRRLGTDLRNDHPISFRFDTQLAALDTELVDPGPILQAGETVSTQTPISPMRRYDGATVGVYDSVQCTSCHNPHAVTYPKFLRANLFHNETSNPDPSKNHPNEEILCLLCHEKPGWIQSTHAISEAVRNKYPIINSDPNDPSSGYDFDGIHAVREFSCRNCHDPHSSEGAKRLHREGIDAVSGNSSVENTCYLCHSPNAASIDPVLPAGDPTSPSFPRFLNNGQTIAPDIYSEFAKDGLDPNCLDFPECGSSMNLNLDSLNPNHSPFFLARPQEGVQLMSQGVPLTPSNNEETPGSSVPDLPHIECVDCHNPHQVISPAIDPPGRIKGMKGVGIDQMGNPLVVGSGEVGVDIDGRSVNRDPYVYEVCFRCHGNSYTNIFGPNSINNSSDDRFPDNIVTVFIPTNDDDIVSPITGVQTSEPKLASVRTDPSAPAPNNINFSFKGFSNKFKEFNPETPLVIDGQIVSNKNTSFHPVVSRGRNGTVQLQNQLAGAFPTAADPTERTINCTDCHNNDATSSTTQMGPVTFSNLRPTDEPPPYFQDSSPYPVGPHGSIYTRILRAPYDTDILDPARCFERGNPTLAQCAGSDGYQAGHFDKFLLCFQCHNRQAFDPNFGSRTDTSWTNFFGMPTNPDNHWNGNLHMYHLQYSGAMCHECHYNVHSNVEAQNTIFGDGRGSIAGGGGVFQDPSCTTPTNNFPCLPPDGEDGIVDGVVSTHLINFGPQAEGTIAVKPRWAYVWDDAQSAYRFKCYLRCHNETMSTCAYQTFRGSEEATFDGFVNTGSLTGEFATRGSIPNSTTTTPTWCAGGASVQ